MRQEYRTPIHLAAAGVLLGLLFDLTAVLAVSSHASMGSVLGSPFVGSLCIAPALLAFLGFKLGKANAAQQRLTAELSNSVKDGAQEVHDANSFAQSIFENCGHAILVSDHKGTLTGANRAACKVLGYRTEELIGKEMGILHDPEELERLTAHMGVPPTFEGLTRRLRAGKRVQTDVTLIRKDGRRVVIEMSAATRRVKGELVGYFITGIDVTHQREQTKTIASMAEQLGTLNSLLKLQHEELAQANVKLEELALIDELTGVNNRRHFDRRFEKMMRACIRSGEPLSLIMLDVDQFKNYNDTFGHPAGDILLRTVGRVIAQCANPGDFVARVGGEEFAVILPLTSGEAAKAVAERIRKVLEEVEGLKRQVTASLGVASSGPRILSPLALLQAADQALYEAKKSGRNQVIAA